MGLYDEFIAEVACPKCGEQLSALQTKSLPDPFLMQYRLGDELQITTADGLAALEIREGRLRYYTSCRAGRAWSNWHAIIEHSRWAGIELVDWHEPTVGEQAQLSPTE